MVIACNISLVYLAMGALFYRLKYFNIGKILFSFFTKLVRSILIFFLKFYYCRPYYYLTLMQLRDLRDLIFIEKRLTFYDRIVFLIQSLLFIDIFSNILFFIIVFYKSFYVRILLWLIVGSMIFYNLYPKGINSRLDRSYVFDIHSVFLERIGIKFKDIP